MMETVSWRYMSRPEQSPNALPPELAAFLKDHPYACVTQATDRGTVLVLKAPGHDIDSIRGQIPIHLRHELYQHPAAPVIRLLVTIYDQPIRPLTFETFIDVEDPQQHDDFAALALQSELAMLFYDEQLGHRLTKVVSLRDPANIRAILHVADQFLAATPAAQFDFNLAKVAVMRAMQL